MTLEEARKVVDQLHQYVRVYPTAGKYDDDDKYVGPNWEKATATLDGTFTLDELRAIVVFFENRERLRCG